jgi:tetratricopeptide (TPR) repeat protein
MRFAGGLPAVLFGTAIVIVQVQVASALTPAEVAQQITVRIDGANTGSGVIIEHQGSNYTVVTNWHVVQEKGNYTVYTQDSKQYTISQIKRLPNVDLAVFQFTSNQNYQVAQKGNSDQVTLGKSIYVAGYPEGTSDLQFLSGSISSLVRNPKDGYALVYTVNAFPGMSGGPILDEQGKLVGIHGRVKTRPDTNATTVYGIPLKTYLSLISANLPVATVSPTLPPEIAVSTSPRRSQNLPVNSQLSNAQAYVDRGVERFFKGDEQGGVQDLQQAQKLDISLGKKLEQQGLSLAQEAAQLAQFQQFKLALPRAKLATYLAPKNDKVWFLLGGLYLQNKQFDTAIAALNKAQSLNPKNADVQFALGSANFQQEKYQAAAEYYQAGLKLKPNDSEGLFDLGNAYYKLNRLPEAIAQYNKAVAADKKFWPAINNVGLINYEQGNIPGAIKQWQTAVAIEKKAAEPLLALAVALYTKGDRASGLAMGKQALGIDKRYGNIAFLKENLWGDRLLADTKKLLQYLEKHDWRANY